MISFRHPTTILISGPTQCGKTYLFKQFIAYKLIQPPPSRILYGNSERPAEVCEFPNWVYSRNFQTRWGFRNYCSSWTVKSTLPWASSREFNAENSTGNWSCREVLGWKIVIIKDRTSPIQLAPSLPGAIASNRIGWTNIPSPAPGVSDQAFDLLRAAPLLASAADQSHSWRHTQTIEKKDLVIGEEGVHPYEAVKLPDNFYTKFLAPQKSLKLNKGHLSINANDEMIIDGKPILGGNFNAIIQSLHTLSEV